MSKWEGLTQKQWRKELQALILASDLALYRAIVRIWKNQTFAEQSKGEALIVDGVGFNKLDAGLLSSYAEQIIKRNYLSDKQKAIARKLMPKYWRQLMVASKRNLGIK